MPTKSKFPETNPWDLNSYKASLTRKINLELQFC